MMSREQELIDEILALKQGNQELMIYRHDAEKWTAEIGNRTSAVMLGEINGEFDGEGSSIIGALESLLKKLRRRSR